MSILPRRCRREEIQTKTPIIPVSRQDDVTVGLHAARDRGEGGRTKDRPEERREQDEEHADPIHAMW